VLFQKPGCRQCNRARDWLNAHAGVHVLERDILYMPPSGEFLRAHVRGDGDELRRYLNPHSASYRREGLSRELPDREALLELLLEDPELIRRPLVVRGGRAVFGNDPDALRTLLD
jgi:arsenate reductase-like glutaredoxin family protein